MAILPFLGACSQDRDPEAGGQPTSDIVPITLRFETENEGTSTRGELDGTETGDIGSGWMIDVLLFAIYDSEGNLQENYQEDAYKSLQIDGTILSAGKGQNIMKYEDAVKGITLNFDLRKSYRVVAWAQSSKCNAYNTKDFKEVEINYAGALNNDDSRDAFCKSMELSGEVKNTKVILRRPFAQINVGTTGADYHNNRLLQGGTYYTKSSVTLSGASTKINVVDDIIDSKNTVTAVFASAKIPAYLNMEVPAKDEDLLGIENEQYLKIHFTENGNSEFLAYKTDYPTKDEQGNYLTETFKYLSMCYVLVPNTTQESSSVISNLSVTFDSEDRGDSSLTLANVPVKRNWRTNILGGLYYFEKPDTPGNPDPDNPDNPDGPGIDRPIDDPTTLFNSVGLNLEIKCDYFNDNNFDINGNPIL